MIIELSAYATGLPPSSLADVFNGRADAAKVHALRADVGNVSRPMHPEMMKRLDLTKSPFKDGVIKYPPTSGYPETQRAFLNIIAASGFPTEGLHVLITNGASAAIDVLTPLFGEPKPIMFIDPTYSGYYASADKFRVKTVALTRHLQEDGKFTRPNIEEVVNCVKASRPSLLQITDPDNPTGQIVPKQMLVEMVDACVKHGVALAVDGAYRELSRDGRVSSVWGLREAEAKGVEEVVVGIETGSKMENFCGARVGAFVTRNTELYRKALKVYEPQQGANAIAQYIFGALAHVDHASLRQWFAEQRNYYYGSDGVIPALVNGLRKVPGIIVSEPEGSMYVVVDLRNLRITAEDFALFCAGKGRVDIGGDRPYTLITRPMPVFYKDGKLSPGATQLRISCTLPVEEMCMVPFAFSELLLSYERARKEGQALKVKV